MSPFRAFNTLAKALTPGESSTCQSSVEGMEGSVHLIPEESSYMEKEGPLLSDSHVVFRVSLFFFYVMLFDFNLPFNNQNLPVTLLKLAIPMVEFQNRSMPCYRRQGISLLSVSCDRAISWLIFSVF